MSRLTVLILCFVSLANAQPSPYGSWVEADFPFFSSILDARRAGVGEMNLTPRGIVLPLGNDCRVCYDVDLLRVSAIWRGKGVSDKALAPGSYHDPGRKTLGGQMPAPQPDGKFWMGNGIYPGWQSGAKADLTDPRESAPTETEVGRGALAEGQFKALRLCQDGVVLELRVGNADIREFWQASVRGGREVIARHVEVSPADAPLWLVVGAKSNGPSQELDLGVTVSSGAEIVAHDDVWLVKVPPHAETIRFCVSHCDENAAPEIEAKMPALDPPARRWIGTAETKISRAADDRAYVVDEIGLPQVNRWKRAVRLSDVQFLPDGTGYGVTIDGDVWRIDGLDSADGPVRWSRFASGLHEPMSLAIRDGEIYVFDRNGVWRLTDTDGNGEADAHVMFCNRFAQTADMREFPSTLRPGPEGEFYIAKGGQAATTLGKHNGSVLRISADGQQASVIGYGLRQPNLGVNVRTGLVTCSDQEGHYVPSTPLHIVRDRQFYGFLSELEPRGAFPAPIADPLTWIPHAVNASAMSQVWLFGARMGGLNDSLLHIGFNKPEIFSVLLNEREAIPQAAVVSITDRFDFPLLNGSVNPKDGQLYVAGFQVIGWGNVRPALSGMARVRYTGQESLLPVEIAPMDKGVLLRFGTALDEKTASDPANFSLSAWSYKRSHTYGSAQYKADGSTGTDALTASSAYLSTDGKAVFLGVPEMKPVMQLRIGWAIRSASGLAMEGNAYTTPYVLSEFDPAKEGFAAITVDLTPRAAKAEAETPVTIEEGRKLSQLLGCVACHSVEDQDLAKIGPKWNGLFGSQRRYQTPDKKHHEGPADAAYLRESILDPGAKVIAGFEKGEIAMPSYAGVVSDAQLKSLVLYIQSLR